MGEIEFELRPPDIVVFASLGRDCKIGCTGDDQDMIGKNAGAYGDHQMTEFEHDPPELAIYRKALRMFRAGNCQHEFARLDPDGSIFLKIHSVDEWGSLDHDRMTVLPGDVGYEFIRDQHGLTNPGDDTVLEKKLIDGQWHTLTKPRVYRWVMLMDNGEILIKLDEDSEERLSPGTAKYVDLIKEHNLANPGDNSVIEIQ